MSAGSTRTSTRYRRSNRTRALQTRRKGMAGLLALIVCAVLLGLILSDLSHVVQQTALPLHDVSVIRKQAAEKHLDPALIAAVIYAETKFDPRRSVAGAEGLMQIEPATAEYLAKLSGGYKFTIHDLGTPAVNVAYGSYYLRYLLDHYEGNEMQAIAAYNAGLANVDSWIAKDRAEGTQLTIETIPFPETREYVQRVLAAENAYRTIYPRQLGLG
jgi:soluble lytic murein transglycosylase